MSTSSTLQKCIVRGDGLPQPPFPCAPAVRVGDWVFASGQLATDFVHGLAPEARVDPRAAYLSEPVKLQAAYIYQNLRRLYAAAGSSLDSLARVEYFLVGREHTNAHSEERRRQMGQRRPTSAALPVSRLLVDDALVQVDGIAVVESDSRHLEPIDSERMRVNREAGFEKGLRFGDWLFVAGSTAGDHVPRDPFGASTVAPEAIVDPNYWLGSRIKRQVRYIVKEKLFGVLEEAGYEPSDIVSAHVYLSDVATDYAAFTEVWRELFPNGAPSTVVAPVNGFGVAHARAEISVIAARRGRVPVDIIEAPDAFAAPGHAPLAMRAGDLIWCSTLMAADANGLRPDAVDPPGLAFLDLPGRRQMAVIVDNLGRILSAAGSDLDHVVKLIVYCSDLAQFPGFVDVWKTVFGSSPPAISAVEVRGAFPAPGCTVAVDAVAVGA